ncbi:MAG: hypothetical protein STSR0008_14050 [Ignavibacterium sp.]
MKVLWLAPFPIKNLLPELKIGREIGDHAASWIINLAEELAKQNDIELHIVTHSPVIPYSQELMKGNVIFHVIKYSFPFSKYKGFPWYLPLDKLTWYNGLSNKILHVINSIKPNIIHAHGTENVYALVTNKYNVPSIVSIQGIISEYFKVSPSISYLLQLPIEKYAINKNKNFGCRTEWDKNIVHKYNKDAKIYYMPEAINPIFFEQKWEPYNNLNILFVGYLSKRKGIEVLLNSVAIVKEQFPNVTVKIVGSVFGNYAKKLKSLTEYLKIEKNIIWLGQKQPEEIADLMAHSTLFVLPTFIDNSPNSLAEAMAVGIPSIASNVGGIPSMISNKKNGFLVEPKDQIALSNKIIYCLNNQKLLKDISKEAKQAAILKNYPSNVVNQTKKVYRDICSV